MNELRQLQLSELEILKTFKKICEENGLRYYLQAGTLLGAVRHHGFIPWDDDIDVSMPREDYDKFALIADAATSEDYYYQDCRTEPNFPYFFSKLRRNDIEVYEEGLRAIDIRKGQYIDIFPLDYCPDGALLSSMYYKFVHFFGALYMSKVNREFVCGYTKPIAKLLFKMFSGMSLDQIREARDRIAALPAKLSSGKRLCTVGGVHGFPYEAYKSEWFRDSIELEFEGELFSAPAQWDAVLKNMYGNYMEFPKEEERTGHFSKEGKQ